ncbi:MAG: site-specific integrase [Candidatus Sedimenticola sp. (ex Thyasira tokunagai)]
MSYRVRMIVSEDSGSRFPLLFSEVGLPIDIANRFLLTRAFGSGYKTVENLAKNILQLYRWADTQKASVTNEIYERIKSGYLYSHEEVDSLVRYLSKNQRNLYKDSNVLEFESYVSGAVLNQKIDAVKVYLKFLGGQGQARRSITDPYYDRIQASVSNLCEALESRKVGELKEPKEGLSHKQQVFLLNCIEPESVNNPFSPRTQYRNYLIIKILYLTGMRSGELLSLRIENCDLKGDEPFLRIVQNTEKQQDPRLRPPEVKTVGRKCYILRSLADEIDHYILIDRKMRGRAARKQPPYLFLGTHKDPKPLSQSSLNGIFSTLREKFMSEVGHIHPHLLRHTFNDNLLRTVGKDMETVEFEKLQRHLCGWASNSEQALKYEQRALAELGRRKLMELQTDLMGTQDDKKELHPELFEDVPF